MSKPRSAKLKFPIEIGRCFVHGLVVRIYVDDDNSGCYLFPTKDDPYGKIYVGIADGLDRAIDIFLHESFEMNAHMADARYRPDGWASNGSDGSMFIMTHAVLTDQIHRIASNLSVCLDELRKVCKRYNRERGDI